MDSGWLIATGFIGLMAFVILADVAYRIYAAGRIQHLIENVPPFGVIEDCRDAPCESVSIAIGGVGGGCQLAASLYEPQSPAKAVVVFCHELDGNRWTALNYIRALVDSDIAVLSFDFCNHGDSAAIADYTPIHWVTEVEVSDLQAALRWVKSQDRFSNLKVGLFGVSRGGCAALIVASMRSDITAVVTDSAYSTRSLIWSFTGRFSRHVCPNWFFNRLPKWHVWQDINAAIRRGERKAGKRFVHLEDVAGRLCSQVLMIAGSRDSYVTEGVRKQLMSILPADTQLWLVPKAKHNRARLQASSEYDSKIVGHFRKHLVEGHGTEVTVTETTSAT